MVQKVMERICWVKKYWLWTLLQIIIMLLSINMVLCGICKKAARFLENKGLINSIDPHGWF